MKFAKFQDVDWTAVFGRFYVEVESGEHFSLFKETLRLLKTIFCHENEYCIHNVGSRILFFISRDERKSINDAFETVRSLEESDKLYAVTTRHHIFFFKGLNDIFTKIPIWIYESKALNISLSQRIYIVRNLLQLYRLEETQKRLELDSYKLLVTYYDSWVPEAYMVQKFKLKGIKTATLQHGQFTAKCGNSFIDSGVEFRTSGSDYFLCWNKFTRDEAIKSGLKPEKLIIAGIWTYINKEREVCHKNRRGVFGVVISHPSYAKENEILIKAANKLSEKYNLKYYLKLHPIFKEDHFSKSVNSCYIGNIKKGISMLDYANQVDFTLIGSTSVFVELIYVGHDVYRYSSGEANDKYKSIKIGKYFNNPDEITTLYLKEKENDYTGQLFDYLCTVADVTKEYVKFLERFQ